MANPLLTRRSFLHGSLMGAGLLSLPGLAGCLSLDAGQLESELLQVGPPRLRRPYEGAFAPTLTFHGPVGERVAANHRHWLLLGARRNPDMMELLREGTTIVDFDTVPPWFGEFCGKYLISAAQAYVLQPDVELLRAGNRVVEKMIEYQHSSGYIGIYYGAYGDSARRGQRRRMNHNWDAWNQYHCILGLLRWHQATRGAAGAIDARTPCLRAADYLAGWGADGIAAVKAGDEQMNLACSHVFALLYAETRIDRYRILAPQLHARWMQICAYPGGDPYRAPPFYQFHQHRWEALHDVQTLTELGIQETPTTDSGHHALLESIWRSIRSFDVHNNGGFSSGEGATGNPYDPGAIETCATVAWMAVCTDLLRVTGRSFAADALEIALWNSVLGAQCPEGHMYTYDTPMGGAIDDQGVLRLGTRTPADEELWWQRTRDGKALSCCALNGPRGIGSLAEWAVMLSNDGIAINYYGPSSWTVPSPSGQAVTLAQQTSYPSTGAVRITVSSPAPERWALRLRIPGWSTATTVTVNGHTQPGIAAGEYAVLDRTWTAGDVVELALDMTPRHEVAYSPARVSIYRGPILLAYDPRHDTHDPAGLPPIDRDRVQQGQLVPASPAAPTVLTMSFATTTGAIRLCDFASAGQPARFSITAAQLVGPRWQLSRLDGTILAESLRLLPDGTISGYQHPNEARWGTENGALVFRTSAGVVSSRLFQSGLARGKMVLQGPSLFTPTITHVLSQQDPVFAGKSFQFRRGDGTVIAPRIRLGAGGIIEGYYHPNEAGWTVEAGRLVFCNSGGAATTRFTSQRTRRGNTTLRGPLLGNPAIEHILVEIDDDVTNRIWDFVREIGTTIEFIARLRLLPDRTIFRFDRIRYDHEWRWGYDRGALAFLARDGAVTTRFDRVVTVAPDHTRYAGGYIERGNPTNITHVLHEYGPTEWQPGPLYASWLPAS